MVEGWKEKRICGVIRRTKIFFGRNFFPHCQCWSCVYMHWKWRVGICLISQWRYHSKMNAELFGHTLSLSRCVAYTRTKPSLVSIASAMWGRGKGIYQYCLAGMVGNFNFRLKDEKLQITGRMVSIFYLSRSEIGQLNDMRVLLYFPSW